jgi:hypothetical protein
MPRVTITVPDKNAQPYRFQLDRQVVTLGRGSENDIPIECGSVSVNHAEMRRIEGGYELIDVGSTNGIKLDGVRQQVVPLRSGATVKLGDVAFDFLLTDEEREALAREKTPEDSPLLREFEDNPQERIAKQRAQHTAPPSKGLDLAGVLMFLILAAAAFFAGLAVRHQKDTGTSLIQAMQANFAVRKTMAAPKPAAEMDTKAPAAAAPAAAE